MEKELFFSAKMALINLTEAKELMMRFEDWIPSPDERRLIAALFEVHPELGEWAERRFRRGASLAEVKAKLVELGELGRA